MAENMEPKPNKDYEEWKKHFGQMAENEEKRPFLEKMAKGKKLQEWAAGYGGEYQGEDAENLREEIKKEQVKIEKAEIPEKKPETEEILKEAGVQADAIPEAAAKKEEELIENQAVRQEILDKLWEKAIEGKPEEIKQLAEKVRVLNRRENILLSVFKKGKELAIRGGKILAAAGLSPFAALEIIGQEAVGRFQAETGEKKRISAEAEIEKIGKIRDETKLGPIMNKFYSEKLNHLWKTFDKSTKRIKSGYEKIEKKGFLLKSFEKLFFNRKEKDIK